MLSFLYVYSDHSILECYNLFSGVELSMRSFFVISANFDVSVLYRVAPFLYLKALFIVLLIRDLSKSCGMEVYRVEKSNV